MLSNGIKLKEDFNYENLKNLDKCRVPLDPTKKTGLGSSAALITSFLGAMLPFMGIIAYDDENGLRSEDLRPLHIYSQILNAFV